MLTVNLYDRVDLFGDADKKLIVGLVDAAKVSVCGKWLVFTVPFSGTCERKPIDLLYASGHKNVSRKYQLPSDVEFDDDRMASEETIGLEEAVEGIGSTGEEE